MIDNNSKRVYRTGLLLGECSVLSRVLLPDIRHVRSPHAQMHRGRAENTDGIAEFTPDTVGNGRSVETDSLRIPSRGSRR